MDQLSLALRYASHGWYVLPIHSNLHGVCSCRAGKSCVRAGEHPRRGWRRHASINAAAIKKVWSRTPEANIGIALGKKSNIIAINCDPAKGAIESLKSFQAELGPLASTLAWRTGNGGMVLLFEYPTFRLPSRANFAPGLRVLSDGDYVVAPRSRDASGHRCTWPKETSDKTSEREPLPSKWMARLRAMDAADDSGLVVTTAINVVQKNLEWLWPHRIALGKLSVIAGHPDLGKSQLAAFLAATVSTGQEWPCCEGRAPLGNVIMLIAEDDAGDTVIPRLEAANADLSRIHLVDIKKAINNRRPFDLLLDAQALEEEIRRFGDIRLVIIDPIAAFLKSTAVQRAAAARLQQLAANLNAAVIAVSHLAKTARTNALAQVTGSFGLVAVARAVFIVAQEKGTDRRLFLPAKNNLASVGTGLAYRTEAKATSKGIISSAVVWDSAPVMVSADEALASVSGARKLQPALTDAVDFLRILLSAGRVSAPEVRSEARDAGVSSASLRRAAGILGVRSRRVGGFAGKGGWFWELPDGPSPDDGKTRALTNT